MVTRSALQNAASIGKNILTTEAIIAEMPEKEAAGMPGGGMGGMDGERRTRAPGLTTRISPTSGRAAGLGVFLRGPVAAGVIDPAMVTRSALQNAASIAKNILTTEAIVAEMPEKEQPACRAAAWAAWTANE